MAAAKVSKRDARQRKTFARWGNIYLKRKGYNVIPEEELTNAFVDGIQMLRLLNALYDEKIPRHNKKCKMRPQQMDNCNIALKMIEKLEIPAKLTRVDHLLDGDFKGVLGLMWIIIQHHAKNSVGDEGGDAKKGLLLWIKKQLKGYDLGIGREVDNFNKDWKNGLAFNALLDKFGFIDNYSDLDAANAEENITQAFAKAEESLDVPPLMDVEDLLVAKPDEKAVVTYLAEWFKVLSKLTFKEASAAHISKFIAFQLHIAEMQTAYENRLKDYLGWVDTQSNEWANQDLGGTQNTAAQTIEDYKKWVQDVKPARMVERIDIEQTYANIQTELAINGREKYAEPDGLALNDLHAAVIRLNDAEAKFAEAARNNRFKFIEAQESGEVSKEKIAEFEEAFNFFDANQSGDLDASEFSAALNAVGIAWEDEDGSKFLEISAGKKSSITMGPVVELNQYIQFMTEFYEQSDSYDSICASMQKLGATDLSNVAISNFASAQREYVNDAMGGDGNNVNFDAYCAKVFGAEQS